MNSELIDENGAAAAEAVAINETAAREAVTLDETAAAETVTLDETAAAEAVTLDETAAAETVALDETAAAEAVTGTGSDSLTDGEDLAAEAGSGDSFSFVISALDAGERIDKVLAARIPGQSRSYLKKLIKEGCIRVGEKSVKPSACAVEGQSVSVFLPVRMLPDILPEDIPLDIVYEDDDLLVVNKPKGMVVHPAPGNPDGTLVNALLFHCKDQLSGINGVIRPGIVHRIDKDTSGLLIVAKNDVAHRALAEQIKEHSFTREYRAVVHGNLKEDTGTVDRPIGRSPKDRKKMAVTDKNSRPAVTHYEVLDRYPGYTYIKCRLETGRTHQIRVHLASLGHPVAGDPVYGPKNTPTQLHGQCLHAGLIGFVHPRTGEYLEFTADLPEYFRTFLEKRERTRPI